VPVFLDVMLAERASTSRNNSELDRIDRHGVCSSASVRVLWLERETNGQWNLTAEAELLVQTGMLQTMQ
jgi:hypothetical protein